MSSYLDLLDEEELEYHLRSSIELHVENLIVYLRSLEKECEMSGVNELTSMFNDEIINQEMFENILPAVVHYNKEFKINIIKQ